ncbi:MAG: radical SAM protein [Methanocellales archaeon]|nr:radical SAM protein [Methanocellales archaeon]MDI6902487.1 radical SAM protein [Methanocellales archaeon]
MKYLDELKNCKLCEWRCGVNRLEGERGVCGITIPEVASSMLHPAPPASYDAFLVGCSFRCLFCQNWRISNYPDNPASGSIEGYYPPKEWAELAVHSLRSFSAKMIGADRLFFTGGEPTCSLPWVEEVVKEARRIDASTKVNYDTNGFLTMESLKRVLRFSTSITFDIKAYNEDTFRALTGAPVEPVLRNAEYVGKRARDKLYEFRIMVIPGIHEKEIPALCEFIASIDLSLPTCFLAFRPNFIMDSHKGATRELMEFCVDMARKRGLENVGWSGSTGISGELPASRQAKLASAYALEKGCARERRSCGECDSREKCQIKRYVPYRST